MHNPIPLLVEFCLVAVAFTIAGYLWGNISPKQRSRRWIKKEVDRLFKEFDLETRKDNQEIFEGLGLGTKLERTRLNTILVSLVSSGKVSRYEATRHVHVYMLSREASEHTPPAV